MRSSSAFSRWSSKEGNKMVQGHFMGKIPTTDKASSLSSVVWIWSMGKIPTTESFFSGFEDSHSHFFTFDVNEMTTAPFEVRDGKAHNTTQLSLSIKKWIAFNMLLFFPPSLNSVIALIWVKGPGIRGPKVMKLTLGQLLWNFFFF